MVQKIRSRSCPDHCQRGWHAHVLPTSGWLATAPNFQHSSVGKQCVTLCSAILLLLYSITMSFVSAASTVPLSRKRDLPVGHFYASTVRNLVYTICKRRKNMASFSVKEGNSVAHSSSRVTWRQSTPYDHPHVAPRNSPAFCVAHTQVAGEVCEQTNPLNYKNYIDYIILYYYIATCTVNKL